MMIKINFDKVIDWSLHALFGGCIITALYTFFFAGNALLAIMWLFWAVIFNIQIALRDTEEKVDRNSKRIDDLAHLHEPLVWSQAALANLHQQGQGSKMEQAATTQKENK